MVTDATATLSSRLQEITEEIAGGYLAKTVTTADALALVSHASVQAAEITPDESSAATYPTSASTAS
jgi:hypothetical protein